MRLAVVCGVDDALEQVLDVRKEPRTPFPHLLECRLRARTRTRFFPHASPYTDRFFSRVGHDPSDRYVHNRNTTNVCKYQCGP